MSDTLETIAAMIFFAVIFMVLVHSCTEVYEKGRAMEQGYCQRVEEGVAIWTKCSGI